MENHFLDELSILLDNGRIEAFQNYAVPLVVSPITIFEGTLKASGRLLKERKNIRTVLELVASLSMLVKRIPEQSVSRFKVNRYISFFESLIYCVEDQRLENRRASIFDLFKVTLHLFDFTGRYLIIRKSFQSVADGSVKVTYEPQILAWIVDLYRNSLALDTGKLRVFRDELTFFYGDIASVNYEEVELCFQYFVAIALLIQFQASVGFDKKLLKAAKIKVLDPILAQVSNFKTLCETQKRNFEHMDFLLYTLNCATRVVNKALGKN